MDRRDFIKRTALLAVFHAPILDTTSVFGAEVSTKVKIQTIRLKANNLGAQARFYRDVLLLPVIETDSQVTVIVGYSTIVFTVDDTVASPFYHFAFTIPENQLRAAMEWLQPRCEIETIRDTKDKVIHFRNWNAHACYFLDPEGNILEFIAHHDLDNGIGSPFGPEQISYVSEIGLVVPDVPNTEEMIRAGLGLIAYRGSTHSFAPIGDTTGLLIVCQDSRIWLPTVDVEAEVFPTHIEMQGIEAGFDFNDLPYSISSSN